MNFTMDIIGNKNTAVIIKFTKKLFCNFSKMLWIFIEIYDKIPMFSGVNFTQISMVFLFISVLKLLPSKIKGKNYSAKCNFYWQFLQCGFQMKSIFKFALLLLRFGDRTRSLKYFHVPNKIISKNKNLKNYFQFWIFYTLNIKIYYWFSAIWTNWFNFFLFFKKCYLGTFFY